MAKCINKNHPDFLELVDQLGIDPMILSAKMGVWMENNNSDEWPTLEQLGLIDNYNNIINVTHLDNNEWQSVYDIIQYKNDYIELKIN